MLEKIFGPIWIKFGTLGVENPGSFSLATGASQLRRKQSITCPNTISFNRTANFLVTFSYLKIIDKSYVFFSSQFERSLKNAFQYLSIRPQPSCHSAPTLCNFLKHFCGNL